MEKNPAATEGGLAEALGIAPNTWTSYKKGKKSFDLTEIAKICDVLSVDPEWLLFGTRLEQRLETSSAPDEILPALPRSDFVNLPQYDVRASAGRGLIAINDMPVSETAFERSFLRKLGGAPDHCFMMWSAGDSMLPTIPDNSLLIVDSSQQVPDHDRIYVFSVGNSVIVKRALWRFDGDLELVSDNKNGNYPTVVFKTDRVEDLTVVGRVIFIGHTP